MDKEGIYLPVELFALRLTIYFQQWSVYLAVLFNEVLLGH